MIPAPIDTPAEQLTRRASRTSTRAKVAMALYGDVTYDSRVRREAGTLARAGYDVTIVCLAGQRDGPDLPENVHIQVVRPPAAAVIPGLLNPFFATPRGRVAAIRARAAWVIGYARGLRAWGQLAIEAAGPVDVWHAHDLTGLAAMVPNLRGHVPVVFDSHELFLETGTALELPGPARWLLSWYGRRLVSRVSMVITVNDAVASALREEYGREDVFAVHNCPDRWSPPVERPTVLHDAAGIPREAPIVLYHGALSRNRGLEQLMKAMLEPGLRDAHLVLMGSGEMRDDLVRVSGETQWEHRVHVLSPVPPAELLTWVASADVGAMPLQPSTLNLLLSTPNKLFECLAAGTPAVVSDFPGMRRIVIDEAGGPLGAVCDPMRVGSIAEAIRSILRLGASDMEALRDRCHRAATERWNWDHEERTLLSAYRQILPGLAAD